MHNGKSRQVIRKENRVALKEQEKARKQGNMPVRRQDLMPLLQHIQTLQNRVSSLELTTASLCRALTRKSVFTEDYFNETVKFEQDRRNKFMEVQQSNAPYEDRVKICKEWEIPVKMTVIPAQIKDDHTLDLKDKLALAEKFDIPIEMVNENGLATPNSWNN